MLSTLFAIVVSGNGFVNVIIQLLVVALIFGILLWLIGISPIPEPFRKVIVWILYVVAALYLINFLLGLTGNSFLQFR